ncbi:DUF2225 domain-containing protein [Bacillus sp. FJAT-47783]|uniref:DUF2225 domain-containing protein n=1 Tax=Bacillus sp. FJAT-47783 TaxID=2922712 RepID=UPI001FABA1FE|nr:DUF2225 domain-containing protein [Bacillus sp. FJAT-47783]
MYYNLVVTCIFCNADFQSTKILSHKAKFTRMDSDFCIHYELDNPMYYDIFVCPHCGYAFHKSYRRLVEPYYSLIKENYIQKIKKVANLCGKRTFEDAMRAFKLALLTAQISKERKVVTGHLCLKIAWLYRIQGDKEREKLFLQHAVDDFMHLLSNERLDIQEIDEDKLIYLIADLNSRLDNYSVARKWFSYLITSGNVSKKYRNYALNRWHEYKDIHAVQ